MVSATDIDIPIWHGADAARAQLLSRRRPDDDELSEAERQILRRLFDDEPDFEEAVRRIIEQVRTGGDAAVRQIAKAIDGASPGSLLVSDAEFAEARNEVSAELVAALQHAADRVRRYHEMQLAHAAKSFSSGGLGQLVRPLSRVGLYVPGTAAVYPSTFLHTAIPAQVAGVSEVVIASPAVPSADGSAKVNALKLVAAEIAGVDTVYKVGGAQAIAALAFGTESISAVDKIFGPGNRFVTAAKRRLYGVVGIDAIYGPTETLIVADDTANPELVAADLLAQAEHDNLAAPILISTSETLARAVVEQLAVQSADLPRREIALTAVRNRGGLAYVPDLDEALAIANEYAPEHLALVVEQADQRIGDVRNAGGLFVGEASPEALGDYVAGPSHVMPTGGSARFASALNVGEFMKITTVVQVTDDLLDAVSADAELIAHAEQLDAHARSLERRRRDR
ncbi:MAG: histidinol dehydrogenase [Chloroflexota bacterium]|nr:histidinol dehydrogenase [Chloroflexota bacterium]MDE2894145.1 histidinol dehydrogenase [Chloroflexota bacterium]